MARYRYLGNDSEPPPPATGVAIADTLADLGQVDDDTVLGLVVQPTEEELATIAHEAHPDYPVVVVQWDHGPRGFEYLEDLAVLVPDNDRAPA